MTVALPRAAWQALGVRTPRASRCPAHARRGAGHRTDARVSSSIHNYDALLEYNCAHAYAISVGLLADRIAGADAGAAAGQGESARKSAAPKTKKKTRYRRPSADRRSRRHRRLPVVRAEEPARLRRG